MADDEDPLRAFGDKMRGKGARESGKASERHRTGITARMTARTAREASGSARLAAGIPIMGRMSGRESNGRLAPMLSRSSFSPIFSVRTRGYRAATGSCLACFCGSS